MTRPALWFLTLLVVLLGGPLYAEDEAETSDSGDWTLRLSAHMGPSFFSYEETLSRLRIESEFSDVAYTTQIRAEGNLAGVSPLLAFQTSLVSGVEEADVPNVQQEQNLDIYTLLLDAGVGYRLEVGGSWLVFVPSVSYSFRLMDFERSDFEFNGTEVLIQDLDGVPQDEIAEVITGHGVTFGLVAELALFDEIQIDARIAYTWFDEAKVVNTLGGTTISDGGFILRGGIGAIFWFTDAVGFGVNTEVLWQDLEKSDIEIQTGSVATASVQFPDSETIQGAFTFGIHAKF